MRVHTKPEYLLTSEDVHSIGVGGGLIELIHSIDYELVDSNLCFIPAKIVGAPI
jgi:hypothetical protein